MTVSIRFMYKSYTQCQKVRKGSLTEKRKRDRSMSKGHRSELKVLKGRAVPSPPFICLSNHLCISVCPHGHLFYSSGYNSVVCSVVSNSLQPTRLLCPWDFPGKNIGAGYPFLLQEIFPTHRSNLGLWRLLRWQVDSLPLAQKSLTSDWDSNPRGWDSNPAETLFGT